MLKDLLTDIIKIDNILLIVRTGGAIIEMGNIYLREDGTAQVAISITYGNLGASGLTYVLEDIEGRWHIVGNTGTRWMA